MTENVTPNGKEVEIVAPKYNSNMYTIQFKSGGELPKILQGGFLTRQGAQEKINVYLAELERKANRVVGKPAVKGTKKEEE